MKYILAILMFIPTMAIADVYVVTAPDNSVYSISEQNDAVVPPGYSKDVIKNKNIKSLQLGDDKTLYTYHSKNFNLDDQKVAKKNKDMQDASAARQAKADAKLSAMAKLKALGLTDDELKAIIN